MCLQPDEDFYLIKQKARAGNVTCNSRPNVFPDFCEEHRRHKSFLSVCEAKGAQLPDRKKSLRLD